MSPACRLANAAVAAALIGCVAAAHATLTVYTNRPSFEAALIDWATDDFAALEPDPGPIARTAGGFGYTASVDGGLFVLDSPTGHWLSTTNMATIRFDGFTGGVQAVGGYFFSTDVDGGFVGGESITLSATDADGGVAQWFAAASTDSFVGFVSTGALDWVDVAVVDTGFNNAWPTLGSLTLGGAAAAPTAAVPTPPTAPLALLGLAGLAAQRRLRRR